MGRALVCASTKLSCCCGCGVTSYFCYDGLMSLGIKRHQTWRHKLYVSPSLAVSTLLPDNESTLDAQILLSNSVVQDCGSVPPTCLSVARLQWSYFDDLFQGVDSRLVCTFSYQRSKRLTTNKRYWNASKIDICLRPVAVMKLSAFAAMPNMTSVRALKASSNSTMRPFRRPMTFGYLLI